MTENQQMIDGDISLWNVHQELQGERRFCVVSFMGILVADDEGEVVWFDTAEEAFEHINTMAKRLTQSINDLTEKASGKSVYDLEKSD